MFWNCFRACLYSPVFASSKWSPDHPPRNRPSFSPRLAVTKLTGSSGSSSDNSVSAELVSKSPWVEPMEPAREPIPTFSTAFFVFFMELSRISPPSLSSSSMMPLFAWASWIMALRATWAAMEPPMEKPWRRTSLFFSPSVVRTKLKICWASCCMVRSENLLSLAVLLPNPP